MRERRRVTVLVFPGFELLDLAGPASVFSAVEPNDARAYELSVLSTTGALVRSSSGIEVATRPLDALVPEPLDTWLVVGGTWASVEHARADARLLDALRRALDRGARVAAVCAGAFVLAATGALDGRRATTHWRATRELAARHPAIRVEDDTLYVRDGRTWTSAGATAGIDMALAMLESDLGPRTMGEIARQLVADRRRPGDLPQHSALLTSQVEAAGPLGDVLAYVDAHLDRALTVAQLARRAGMSTRTFQRRFVAALGRTPARLVTERRLDRARALVEAGLPIKAVAHAVGFASEAGFRTAFEARFGASPSGLARAAEARAGE